MTDVPNPRDDDIALAGEYVLGVLDLPARMAVEQRMRTDTAFAALVTQWERNLSTLNAEFDEVPAPDLMPAIEARLFGRQEKRARSTLWRFGLGGLVAGALALAVFVFLPTGQAPVGPVLTASLQADGQALAFTAQWDAASRELVVRRTTGSGAEEGRVHELWVIAGEGAAPVSLGLLQTAELRRPLEVLAPGAVLAVSLEPAGGSPTGAPTGPVLVTGVVGL